MVWVLRVFLGALALGYAAWLCQPLAEALSSGLSIPQVWSGLAENGTLLAATLLATIAFYGLGGLATVAGLTWAPALYFAGVVGDIALRLAVTSGADFLERRPRVWNIAPTPWLVCEQSRVIAIT